MVKNMLRIKYASLNSKTDRWNVEKNATGVKIISQPEAVHEASMFRWKNQFHFMQILMNLIQLGFF